MLHMFIFQPKKEIIEDMTLVAIKEPLPIACLIRWESAVSI